MLSVELFAGCGGLALGLAEAGFKHVMVAERDAEASATLLANQQRGVRHMADWPLYQGDVRDIAYRDLASCVDLLAGGPPCQPFSIGGKHKGPDDTRNMWPEVIRAVHELRPKAFFFENVRGLLRPAFAPYLTFLRLRLSWPEPVTDTKKSWKEQLTGLLKWERAGREPTYLVVVGGINAADYGAPQKRHRAIMIGVRTDVASRVLFPRPTHSKEALVWSQYVTGEYWERHAISTRARPAITEADSCVLDRLLEKGQQPEELPWTTVRDAIGDLPRPLRNSEPVRNHRLHPGARVYPRHTGSTLDEPAKALKAGDHGVPGGENVLVHRNGRVRYFTIREMARLQGFPDDFAVDGRWKGPIKQLGNAVPVQVGRTFGLEIRKLISDAAVSDAPSSVRTSMLSGQAEPPVFRGPNSPDAG